MKINIISHSDGSGGAARAAYRLHRSLIDNSVDSEMIVKSKKTQDMTVISTKSKFSHFLFRVVGFISNRVFFLQKTKGNVYRSLNLVGSYVFKLIKKSDSDVVNIHWINSETLSINQVAKINKPLVLTLHDMWAFCGAEHLSVDKKDSQFRVGYKTSNVNSMYRSGVDIDSLIWKHKLKTWNTPFTIVTPSLWLSKCVRDSIIFSGWQVHTIPNTIDTNVFTPIDKIKARKALGLRVNAKLIGFGAIGGSKDKNKGFDLLLNALDHLTDLDGFECLVFGGAEPNSKKNISHPMSYLGHVSDDNMLALFYSAIDVMVVPSRQEAFGQTASEAQSCSTPVACFDTTGLRDVVLHKKTGYLARPFDTVDLADGIKWCINENVDVESKKFIRERAVSLWSYKVISDKYRVLYESVLNSYNENKAKN